MIKRPALSQYHERANTLSIVEKIIDLSAEYELSQGRAPTVVFLGFDIALSLCLELRRTCDVKVTPRELFESDGARRSVINGLEIHRQEDDQPSLLVGRLEYGRHGERYLY